MQPVQAPFPKTKTPLSKPLEKLKQFGEWLFSYIPPKPKVLDTTFNALKQKVMSLYKKSFEVKESESALGGFTTKYTIAGQAGYDRTHSTMRLKNQSSIFSNQTLQQK